MTAALDARQGALAADLAGLRISRDEFCRRFPVAPEEASALGLSVLRRALRQRYADDVEHGLALAFSFGVSPDYLDTLHALAGGDWHTRHAGVVDALDKLVPTGAPVSADVLYRTALARHAYLEEDEHRENGEQGKNHEREDALGAQCAGVLGNLRTRTAALRLGDLLGGDNAVLAAEAERQLRRILDHDGETRGPGVAETPATVRALAGQLLAARRRPTGA
ncbi:MAG TPA: hypothetical protein VH141_09765 [Pseudonocardia sp.]|nr:hypothetical protein [Pseudonocardia sp.]